MLLISETFINQDKGYQFGNTEPYEPFTEDIGRLFRSLQKEYGRCVSHVYIDKLDDGSHPVGWVFEKRMAYEDSPKEFYTREVWVSLHTQPDEKRTTRHYLYLDQKKRKTANA